MNKEYLYHGSPVKVDKLVPNQAYDTGFESGCQYAVYATSNKKMIFCLIHSSLRSIMNCLRPWDALF